MMPNLLNCVVKESHTCRNTCGTMEVVVKGGWGSTAGNGGSGSKSRYLAGSHRLRGGSDCLGLAMSGALSVGCKEESAGVLGVGCERVGVSWILASGQ